MLSPQNRPPLIPRSHPSKPRLAEWRPGGRALLPGLDETMSAALYLCLHLRDFAAQAMACAQPELQRRPMAILSGTAPLEYVFAVNQQARELGVEPGMGRIQAESFAGVAIRPRERALEDRAFAFVFQAEDGIRERDVTGVQTCALPISTRGWHPNARACGTRLGGAGRSSPS